MKTPLSALSCIMVLSLAAPAFTTGCSAEIDDEVETEAVGESEDGLAPAIPIASCLANPACATAVAAALGYAVYSISQLSGEGLRIAQRAANDWFAAQRRGQTCNAHCALVEASSSGGVGSGGQCSGFVSGTGGSRQDAQRDANSRVPRGCRLKHCTIRCQ